MNKAFTRFVFASSRNLFVIGLLGLGLVVACNSPAPTATPAPLPTVVVPTPLPPAPTAPPLTAVPTPVMPTQPPPPTATAVVPPTEPPTTEPTTAAVVSTQAPAATNPTSASTAAAPTYPPTPSGEGGALNGLYIRSLRFDPTYPQTNVPLTFYATIENQTGKDQHYPVCVEIFRPDAPKSFGISSCDVSTIAAGTSEVLAGTWVGSGIKECLPFRARPVLREEGEGEVRQVFTTLEGSELWVDFNVCPQ